jgi:hypothetical protein
MTRIPSGSSAGHPSRPRCRRQCGSTSPSTHRRRLSNFPADVSHRGSQAPGRRSSGRLVRGSSSDVLRTS